MAADYRKYRAFIKKWEGGYSNHKADRGGATNKGVTLKTFQILAPKLFGISGTLNNLKKLTDYQFEMIFKYYWNKATYNNKVNSQPIAEAIAGSYWGSGTKGIKVIQRVLKYHFNKVLIADGGTGPITVKALNSVDVNEFLAAYYKYKEKYYKDIVKNDPTQAVFLDGWINRLNDFKKRWNIELNLFKGRKVRSYYKYTPIIMIFVTTIILSITILKS